MPGIPWGMAGVFGEVFGLPYAFIQLFLDAFHLDAALFGALCLLLLRLESFVCGATHITAGGWRGHLSHPWLH